MKPIRLYFLLTLLLVFAAGQDALADNTWTVQYQTESGKFKISRSGDLSSTENVYYRVVVLSAFGGQHFSGASGNTYFASGVADREVSVSELSPTIDAYKYQNGTTRSYRFEVLDQGGFCLAYTVRSITTGTDVPSDVSDQKTGTIQSNEFTINDKGYKQSGNPHTINRSSFYNDNAKSYLSFLGVSLHMTLELQAKEVDDAYQYLQVIIDNTTACDSETSASGGNPGTPSISSYMAGFEMYPKHTYSEYKTYTFPVTNVEDGTKASNPWGYGTDFPLSMQKFKSGSRSTDYKIIVPNSFNTISVRFDASGSEGTDEWKAKNVKAHIQAADDTRPTRLADPQVPAFGGIRHAKGNTYYISVPFREIVKVTGTPTLSTSWGTLSYFSGSGSNVLTFRGTITADAGTALTVNSISGTIKDLAGNEQTSNNKTIKKGDYGLTVDASYAYSITYDLAGGSMPTANLSTYTYETASFTLNNPIRPGYAFAGWTGSNGNTPETTVTIAAGSHGKRTYTANWTPLWGQDKGATGEDEDHAYVISSPAGLDMLAKVVNGTDGFTANDFNGNFFKLGADITYSYEGLGADESNFTAIGGDINGSFRRFFGTFDGDNKTISGIRIRKGGDDCQGLFGFVSGGTIKNVTLTDADITGKQEVGGIVGFILKNAGIGGIIENCHVTSSVTIRTVAEYAHWHGGIVGDVNGGSVSDCTSAATLTVADGLTNCSEYGGIVGALSGDLQNCLVVGANVSGNDQVGAVAGSKYDDYTCSANYYHSCTVNGTANATGVGVGSEESVSDIPHDRDGVRSVHTLALPAKVTASGESVVISGVTCYASNTTVTLKAEGYDLSNVSYNDGTDHAITPTGGVYSFTMPAADATVSATLEVTPWSGSGTVADPWVIFYPSQLDLLAKKVNGTHGYTANHFSQKFFKLGADIAYDPEDLNENGENYTPIGTVNKSICFYGTFDGDGHTVSGIRINNNQEYQGLFGHIEDQSVVKNLTLANIVITAGSKSGGIVGHSNYGTINNCHVESSVSILAYNDEVKYLGGIAGDNNGYIVGSTSSACVSNNGKTGCMYYGGIAGNSKTVYHCLVLGANISVPSYKGTITATDKTGFNLQNNYYLSCTVNGIENASDVGYKTGDISDRDGAVRAIACDTKPAEIGAQLDSYPFGGLIAYEHGIYYKGVYYLRHDLAGTAATLTLVQGNKDGVTAWWGTFFDSAAGYTLSEGAAAYTMDAEYQLYRLGTDGRTIPAGTPVVILSTTPEATLLPAGSATADDNAPGGNILIGVNANTAIPSICGLSVNNGEVGFYRIEGGILPAHRAGYKSEKAGVQNYDKKNKQEW